MPLQRQQQQEERDGQKQPCPQQRGERTDVSSAPNAPPIPHEQGAYAEYSEDRKRRDYQSAHGRSSVGARVIAMVNPEIALAKLHIQPKLPEG